MSQIGNDIIFNGKTITSEIGLSLEAWRAGDFKSFGSELGGVLRDSTEFNDILFLY